MNKKQKKKSIRLLVTKNKVKCSRYVKKVLRDLIRAEDDLYDNPIIVAFGLASKGHPIKIKGKFTSKNQDVMDYISYLFSELAKDEAFPDFPDV